MTAFVQVFGRRHDETIHVPMWPAAEKRQGTKLRWSMWWWCREGYEATQFDKLHADLLDRSPAVLAEVGNRLVVRSEPAGQPHYLDIAPSLSLKPPARLNPIDIAVDVELHEDRGMIGKPARCLGSHSIKPQPR